MTERSLWELLWDYDPNGLVVIDREYTVQIVNQAFCKMFNLQPEQIKGRPVADVIEDVTDFKTVWEQGVVIKGKERSYPGTGLYLRGIFFPVVEYEMVACILVDLTSEHQRAEDMRQMKQDLIVNVNTVIDKQMKIAQEIAGLLGETTAEAKVSLLRIRNVLDEEIH